MYVSYVVLPTNTALNKMPTSLRNCKTQSVNILPQDETKYLLKHILYSILNMSINSYKPYRTVFSHICLTKKDDIFFRGFSLFVVMYTLLLKEDRGSSLYWTFLSLHWPAARGLRVRDTLQGCCSYFVRSKKDVKLIC